MNKRFVILFLLSLLNVFCFGQERSYKTISNSFVFERKYIEDNDARLARFKKKVWKDIKKHKELSKIKGLRLFFIPMLAYQSKQLPTTKMYRDYSFLFSLVYWNNLRTSLKPWNKKSYKKTAFLMMGEILVTDSVGNFLALHNGCFLRDMDVPFLKDRAIIYKTLSKMFFEGSINYAFYNYELSMRYFCIGQNEMFVLQEKDNGLEKVPWSEYIRHYLTYDESQTTSSE